MRVMSGPYLTLLRCATSARTHLGLTIGTDVLPYGSSRFAALSALAETYPTDGFPDPNLEPIRDKLRRELRK